METIIEIIGIILFAFLGVILVFGAILMWSVEQGFNSKYDKEELKKVKEMWKKYE